MLAVSRQGFIFVPCVIIAGAYLGLNGIIFSQPAADLFSVVMSIVMFVYITKRLMRQQAQPAA